MTLEIEIDYWRLTFDLYIDVEKLWVVVYLLGYSVCSGPFLSYEIGDEPGPKLDNSGLCRILMHKQRMGDNVLQQIAKME